MKEETPAGDGVAAQGGPNRNGGPDEVPTQAGIGVALRVEHGNVFVNGVLPGTAAARADLVRPGDRILAVAEGDGEPVEVTGLDVAAVVGMIRGDQGTTVRLTVLPAGDESESKSISLRRGTFKELEMFVDGRLLSVGEKAPDFAFTRLADGTEARLSQLAGRVVVIDVWATWCGPCVDRLDDLQALPAGHPEWAGRVEVLAVSVDERREDAAELSRTRRWMEVPPVWAGPDLLRIYRVAGLPTVFVIDQEGTVAAVGEVPDLAGVIERLLKPAAR